MACIRSGGLLSLFVLLLFLVSGLAVKSQPSDNLRNNYSRLFSKTRLDTNYVKIYKDKVMLALLGKRKYQHLWIVAKNGQDKINYRPNNPYSFGAGLSYSWFSLDLAVKFPYLTKNYRKKGDTDIIRMRIAYNRPKIWVNAILQACRGFYIDNIESIEPEWFEQNENYPLRPDILNLSIYTSLYYSFNNKKITYQSSMGWEQRQKKSAGTFLLGGSVYANYLHADSSIVPFALQNQYSEDLHITELFNMNYGINFGYVHTFLFTKYLYLTLSIYPGIHIQSGYQINPLNGKKGIGGDLGSVTETHAILGYNTDKYFGGITFNDVAIFGFPENTMLSDGYAYLRFFVGRRFNAPHWVQKYRFKKKNEI
jgi:hypothetical protein